MRDPGPGAGEEVDLAGVELHAVGVPDVLAGPAEVLGVLPGPAAELAERIGDVLVVLGEVGVQHHPLVARERARRRASARSRPRRASRARARPAPSPRARVVEGVDHPHHVGEDRRPRASTRLSGGSPPALSPTLIAPRVGWKRMPIVRAASIVSSSRDAVREEVEVVRAHRAAGERQLGEPELRRDEHVLGLIARPDRIERLQPAEEQRVLPGRHRPGQRLVEVVVGVDEPRRHHAAAARRSPPPPRAATAPTRGGSRRPRSGRRRPRSRGGRRPWSRRERRCERSGAASASPAGDSAHNLAAIARGDSAFLVEAACRPPWNRSPPLASARGARP